MSWKKAGWTFRLFNLFLIYGFVADVLVGLILKPELLSYVIFKSYSLLEALFLFWFLKHTSSSFYIKKISHIFLLITLPVWIFTNYFLIESTQLSNLFDPYYEISSAFLAGFSLLKLSENEYHLTRLPLFWFLVGIFIYCFCTFFISGFLSSRILEKIWFIHNIIAILTYILFSIGFYKFHSANKYFK